MQEREQAREAASRSREGAWIEILSNEQRELFDWGRSREGAWIEI